MCFDRDFTAKRKTWHLFFLPPHHAFLYYTNMKNITIFLIVIISSMCVANAYDAKVNLKLILPEFFEYPDDNTVIPLPVVLDVHYDTEDYDTYIQCPVFLNKDGRVHLTRFFRVYIGDDKGKDIAVFQPLINFEHGLTLLIHARSRAQLFLAHSISAKIDKPGTYYICIIFDVDDNKGNTLLARGDAKFTVRGRPDLGF